MELGERLPRNCHIEIAAREFWVIDDHGYPVDRVVMPERLNRFTFNTEPITTSTYMKQKHG